MKNLLVVVLRISLLVMYFKRFLITLLLFTTASALGFTPSSEQIEEFKKLSKAEQEVLAKQYGIDPSKIAAPSTSSEETTEESSKIKPRLDRESDSSKSALDFRPTSNEIKKFGYELFAGEPTSFMPNENAPVPDTYLIGVGDGIKINFYGKSNENYNVVVDREGRLSIPNLKPVQVAGLTFKEIKQLIKAKVEQEIIGVQAFVSMGKLRNIRILVLGEAYKPGSYSVSSLTTVSHALFVSGGVSDIASLRNIQVKRAGKVVANFDLYDLLIKGDSSNDIILKPGDVVFIPSIGPQVTVEGLVNRPAIFELKENETARELLAMAGGTKPSAYTKKVTVKRFNNSNRKEVISVDFSKANIDYTPKDGDRLRFDPISSQYQNSVTIIGAVVRPGDYEWQRGKRISDLITSIRGDLLPQADLDYGLLVREINVTGDIELYQFNPAAAIAKDELQNLELKENDKLLIFSRYEEKKAEELALKNLALTQEQQLQQKKTEQWHYYQEKEFKKMLGLETNNPALKSDNSNLKSLEEFSKRSSDAVEDDEYTLFSRNNLLKAVIEKLKLQSNNAASMKLVEIGGHVTYPGVYPLTVGSRVNELITAAGGLLESAYTKHAEITRVHTNDESKVEHIKFNLRRALLGEIDEDIKLQSRDVINIFPIPNWQDNVKVTLSGELKFPGTYTIRRGETLSDILQRAGGFTEFAETNAAVFTRQSIKEQERKQLAKLSNELRKEMASRSFQNNATSNPIPYNEMNSILNDLASVEAVGRLVIDLPLIVEEKQKLTLQNGDRLYVPNKQDSITIIGEVNYSTSYLYKEGLTLKDYINQSGGVKERADEDRIYIIKANGSVVIPEYSSWFAVNDKHMLEPGDTIVVPLDSDYMDNLTLWSTATQILYQLGVAVAALSAL